MCRSAGSIISVLDVEGAKVAQYLPWINYYDVDEKVRENPAAWRTVEPATPYHEVVQRLPFGTIQGYPIPGYAVSS